MAKSYRWHWCDHLLFCSLAAVAGLATIRKYKILKCCRFSYIPIGKTTVNDARNVSLVDPAAAEHSIVVVANDSLARSDPVLRFVERYAQATFFEHFGHGGMS